VKLSVFFAPVRDTPDHIALAERLGFARAWCYDSPLLYHDPFVTLARAADRTRRIGLGIGVVVPRLRTPVATAAGLRSLAALAPGRVVATVGAGFTGRFTLGLGPVPLSDVEREVRDLRALLAGDETPHVEGGRPVRQMPVRGADGGADVPIYVSCRGPRAQALARRFGDGAMTGVFYPGGLGLVREGVGPEIPLVVHAVGAVAGPGEQLDSPRLVAAVGPVVAVAFHAFCEQPWRLDGLDPPLRAQAEAYIRDVAAALPPERRHQELHRGHLTEVVLPQDLAVVSADTLRRFGFCGTAEELAARIADMERDGVTELAIQPGGDIPDELHRIAEALL
jgi:5,10-methylenetetrahydromethanopterin reductase